MLSEIGDATTSYVLSGSNDTGTATDGFFEIHDMDQLMLAFYRNQLPKPLKEVATIVYEEAAHNELAAWEVIYEFAKSIS